MSTVIEYTLRPKPAEYDALLSQYIHLADDVDVVLVTHVHSNTGELIPVADVTETATARGIVSIVDVGVASGEIRPVDPNR